MPHKWYGIFNFEFFQNSCIYCDFSLRCKIAFLRAMKIEIFFARKN